jgi:hypothetical protein
MKLKRPLTTRFRHAFVTWLPAQQVGLPEVVTARRKCPGRGLRQQLAARCQRLAAGPELHGPGRRGLQPAGLDPLRGRVNTRVPAETPMRMDAVISSHNLEHCDDPAAVRDSMVVALRPGSSLFLAFPCEESVRVPRRR